jgi:hypothetical protein
MQESMRTLHLTVGYENNTPIKPRKAKSGVSSVLASNGNAKALAGTYNCGG